MTGFNHLLHIVDVFVYHGIVQWYSPKGQDITSAELLFYEYHL